MYTLIDFYIVVREKKRGKNIVFQTNKNGRPTELEPASSVKRTNVSTTTLQSMKIVMEKLDDSEATAAVLEFRKHVFCLLIP